MQVAVEVVDIDVDSVLVLVYVLVTYNYMEGLYDNYLVQFIQPRFGVNAGYDDCMHLANKHLRTTSNGANICKSNKNIDSHRALCYYSFVFQHLCVQ